MVDRASLVQAATDPAAMAARRELAGELGRAFAEVGGVLRVTGHLVGDGRVRGTSRFENGDDRQVAAGYLCEVVAALQAGTRELTDSPNVYAAAALVRQLVEAEYLLWAFASNHDDAAAWLVSTGEERRKMWQPGHIRKRARGQFRDIDYWRHCDFGGHPTPDGVRFLLNSSDGLARELILFESLVHSTGAWDAVQSSGWNAQGSEQVDRLVSEWRAVDELREGLGA